MRTFIWISLLVGSMLCSSACTEGFFERQDKKTIESQLADFLSWPLEDQVGRGKKIRGASN
jgi:hypothetical protein